MDQARTPSVEYHFGTHVFDVEGFQLLHRGEALPLQPKVLDALHHFVLQPRVLVPRDALTQALWPDTHVTANSLEQVIRKLRAALGDTERPYRWIETVPGKGYRFVGELEIKPQARPGFAHDPLAARSARAPLTNLPRRDPGFVGREADCQALAELVRDHPLVTVVGPGGIGKTRLARHVVAQLAHSAQAPPDGSWFCDLTAATDLRGVLQVLEDACGGFSTMAPSPEEALEQLCASLSESRALLLVDNAEHVVEPVARVVHALASRAPDLRVVVTSRRPLHHDAERILHLQPLTPADGVALLEDRAQAARVDLAALPASEVHAIVARLDGIPLAIALAAPRLLLVSPDDLVRRLDEHLRGLRHQTVRDPRHRSLEACFRGSWELLTPVQQRVLAQCAVFRGGFTLAGAEAVVTLGDGPPDVEIDDVLLALCDACLIRPVPGRTPPRFDLWETLRPFAQAELETMSLVQASRARLVRWVVDDLSRWIRGDLAERRAARAERENVWAAWAWVEAPDDVVMCGRILGVIAWSGPTSSLEPVLDRALEAAVASGSEQLPDILHHRAVFHRVHRSDPDAARVDAEALEALARSADTPALHGNAALTMAFASVGADEAIAHLRDAVAYLAEAQDERYLGVARARLAMYLVDRGGYEEAEHHARAALASARARADARQKMHAMSALGVILMLTKQHEACETLLEEFLALTRATGDKAGENTALLRLADLRYARGDLDGAEAVTREALDSEMLAGGRAQLLLRLGTIRRDQGAVEEALTWIDASRPLFVGPVERSCAEVHRSVALALLGRLEEARSPLARALEGCEERSPLVSRRRLLAWWAILDAAAGDVESARERLHQAAMGEPMPEDAGRLELARIALAAVDGHKAEARRRLAALEPEADDRSVAELVRRMST